MNRFALRPEPRGESYRRLLRLSHRYSTEFGFVVRPSVSLDASASDLISRLAPHLIDTAEVTEWPGTMIFDESATKYRFAISDWAIAELGSVARGFSDWIQPGLPEDLFFLRDDGRIWVGSVAHEGDTFIDLADDEITAVKDALPGTDFHPIEAPDRL